MIRLPILLFLLLSLQALPLFGQDPFFRGDSKTPGSSLSQESPTPVLNSTPAPLASPFQAAASWIRRTSRELHSRLSDLTRRVMEEADIGAGVSAFLTAVLFGIIHILGPGHGKVFTVSYFLGNRARLRQGIAYSALVNLVDSLSAGVVVFLGTVVFQVVFSNFQNEASWWLQLVSYSLILILTLGHWISHHRPSMHHHSHPHHLPEGRGGHSGHSHGEPDTPRSAGPSSPLGLAMSVALVPCPVSTAILVYGVANRSLAFSVFLVAGVSLGGFIAMSALAVGVVAGRQQLQTLLHRSHSPAGRVLGILEAVSSGVIILFAGIMLISLLVPGP